MWTIRCSRLRLLYISVTCLQAASELILKEVTLEDEPSNTVERGSNLTLTCHAKIVQSATDSPTLHFTFYKDFDPHNTVYRSSTNTSLSMSYNITKARASDSGIYQCDVRVLEHHKESSPKTITVNGLQTPVLIVDKTSVTEGDTVRVTCSAKEESGELRFFIMADGKQIYQGKGTRGEVHHSIMSVEDVQLSCSYSLFLGSVLLSSNDSNTVRLDVKKLDFEPVITITPSSVIERDSVQITCRLKGKNQGSATMLLSKERLLLSSPEYKTVAYANDSGRYECSVTINNVEKRAYANLTVKELFSTPVLNISPAKVFESEEFNVTCSSLEFASERIGHHDLKYIIYRNNTVLTSNSGMYRAKADSKTNGIYSCSAQVNDTIKWSNTRTFITKVLVSKPTISVLDKVILGRSFRIWCHSDQGSYPITYTLTRNHSVVNRISISSQFQKAVFTASIVSKSQIGEFRCEAQNNGKIPPKKSDRLDTNVTLPVGSVILTTLPGQDGIIEGHHVQLICRVLTGTPPFTFKLYQDANPRPVHTDTTLKNHSVYILRSINKTHSGRYHCQVLNEVEKQEESDVVVIEVKLARWKTGLIVSACLLCAAVLILALVIRCKAKRVKVSGSNGAGIWSERPPVLDSSEIVDVDEPEEPNVEYTEVLHPQTADPTRVPLKKGTDTVYSEVRALHPDNEVCEY